MNKRAISNCDLPKCAACEFGKATKRPSKVDVTRAILDKEMKLKKEDLLPGQRVSVDHYQSAVPGRLYSSRGGSSQTDQNQFHGGAIFVDNATGKIAVCHQVALSSSDTVKSKLFFEKAAYDDGIVIQRYHTDNGVLTSKESLQEFLDSEQTIRFSGSGAAHQNGVAKRSIQTVVNMARTMMLHAAMRSPQGYVRTEHWPMAIDHAVWIYNHLPRMDSGASPEELWTRSTMVASRLLSDCVMSREVPLMFWNRNYKNLV
jgi:hypothetical protein